MPDSQAKRSRRSRGLRPPSPFRIAILTNRKQSFPDALKRTRLASLVYYRYTELPPSRKSMYGKQYQGVIIDDLFEHDADTRSLLTATRMTGASACLLSSEARRDC